MTEKLKTMIDDLYTINIETEKSSTYKATPKLTNADAKNILLLSYYFRQRNISKQSAKES